MARGYPVGTVREWKGKKHKKMPNGKWVPLAQTAEGQMDLFAGMDKKEAAAIIREAEKKAGVEAFFASGSNHEGEIKGFHSVGMHLGVAANELDVQGKAEQALKDLKGTGRKVFLDSGAFGEVNFNVPPDRGKNKGKLPRPDLEVGEPYVVEAITDAEWGRRLDLYDRLADVLGDQLYPVAPDKVAYQAETLERLERYADRVNALQDKGVNMMVPLQKAAPGDPKGLSLTEFDKKAEAILGNSNFIRAVPMKKDATTKEDIVELVKNRKVDRLHLLGLGETSKTIKEITDAIKEASPDTRVTSDAVRITALVGRAKKKESGEGWTKPRKLTAATDRARMKIARDLMQNELRRYQLTLKPSTYTTKTQRKTVADVMGLRGKEKTRFVNHPDDWAMDPKEVPRVWDEDDETFVEQTDATNIDHPLYQAILSQVLIESHTMPKQDTPTVAKKKQRAIEEVFGPGGELMIRQSYADLMKQAKDAGNRHDMEMEHRAQIADALDNYEMTLDEYNELHAKAYGPVATFRFNPYHNLKADHAAQADREGNQNPKVVAAKKKAAEARAKRLAKMKKGEPKERAVDILRKAPILRDALDLVLFGQQKPLPMPGLVQGADNVPPRTSHAETAGMLDELGMTAKGKRKKKKDKKKAAEAARERAKAGADRFEAINVNHIPTGHDGEPATAETYKPQMLKDVEAGGRVDWEHKAERLKEEARRRSGTRVSDITKELMTTKR